MFPPLPKDRKAIVSALLRKPLLEKNDEKALRLLCRQALTTPNEMPASARKHRLCHTIVRATR
jgi:hypothetical protein